MNHGQQIVHRNVDLLTSGCIGAELDGGGHDDRAIVVGSARSLASLPDETVAVGKDAGGNSGTIVAAPADKHHSNLTDLSLDLEVVLLLFGSSDIAAIGSAGNGSGAVGVLATNLAVGVGNVGRVDGEQVTLDVVGRGVAIGKSLGIIRVGGHCRWISVGSTEAGS